MAYITRDNENEVGGVVLKASTTETSSTDTAGVTIGKGRYEIDVTISAIDVASGDEFYGILIEGNTEKDTTTWETLAANRFGHSSVNSTGVSDSATTYKFIVDNPLDYQLRVSSVIGGTSPSITYAVTAYRVPRRA